MLLGKEEEHKEWDSREELRPKLEQEVEMVLGEMADNDFTFELLCDDEIIEALRANLGEPKECVEVAGLSELIQRKKTAYALVRFPQPTPRRWVGDSMPRKVGINLFWFLNVSNAHRWGNAIHIRNSACLKILLAHLKLD